MSESRRQAVSGRIKIQRPGLRRGLQKPDWRWTPALATPPGSPARTHSMMSLSVRPQRRLLSARVNRSQSFAGVLGSHERGPRYAAEGS